MIYIVKNVENRVVLEVSCLTTDEYFLIQFIREFTLEDISGQVVGTCITGPNYSTATERYDEFRIWEQEGGQTVFANDTYIFLRPGQYKYNVYSWPTPITTFNYLSVLETPVLSTGLAIVKGSSTDSIYD